MGLDMYLKAERFMLGRGYEHPDNDISAKVSEAMGGTPGRVVEVKCDIGYWRKANHIHAWFVKNCQDGIDECQETYVSREQLQALLKTCQEVLADPSKGPTLLPTQSGFFFGGTEYDEWYISDLRATVEILEKALAIGLEWSITYRSSW